MSNGIQSSVRLDRVGKVVMGLLLIGGLASQAHADGPPDITDAEWKRLPAYCYFTQLSPGRADAAATQAWYSKLGQNFHSMHHYCWGLIWHGRAERDRFKISRRQYNFMLEKGYREMQFTLARVETKFVLRPEMLTKQGRVFLVAGMHADAERVFLQALDQLPSYWPASVGLGEALLGLGERDKALEVVERALGQFPDVRQLADIKALILKSKSGPVRATRTAPGTSERGEPPRSVDAPAAQGRSPDAGEAPEQSSDK